jgi:hypothetical protein
MLDLAPAAWECWKQRGVEWLAAAGEGAQASHAMSIRHTGRTTAKSHTSLTRQRRRGQARVMGVDSCTA